MIDKKKYAGISTDISNTNEKTIDRIVEVDINKLKSNEKNFYKLSNIDSLIESIKMVGLMNPLKISKDYVVIGGHRRLEALKQMKVQNAPCIFVDSIDLINIVEDNNQRNKTKEERDQEIRIKKEYYKKEKELGNLEYININKLISEEYGVSIDTVKRATKKEKVQNAPSKTKQDKLNNRILEIFNMIEKDVNEELEISDALVIEIRKHIGKYNQLKLGE